MSRPLDVVELLESNDDKFYSYDSPNSIEEIIELEQKLRLQFPDDYRQFLLYCDGGEFHNDVRLSLFSLYKIEVFSTDTNHSLEKYMPGMIFFADDYGDQVFYFDPHNYLSRGSWAIYSVGLGVRDFEYSRYQAQDFTHFIQRALNEEEITEGPWLKDEGVVPRPD